MSHESSDSSVSVQVSSLSSVSSSSIMYISLMLSCPMKVQIVVYQFIFISCLQFIHYVHKPDAVMSHESSDSSVSVQVSSLSPVSSSSIMHTILRCIYKVE
ncbi:hypothetical protein AVEN_7355-1 [Araneus ventricosus]|uniref:Uncharacterized protein n=1 Tax=Araneus ventricosus TaxID=182803 RepID=A0A4Y2BQ88_ARAVE|nr:hypothetical protein AVEN_7355-1 [Araneus ventricosus]